MPVDFLTDEQARRYGRYTGEPTPSQLARYFFLDDRDRTEIGIRRGDHNRLGYALQLCTVRFLGTFLPNPTAVPRLVVHHVARQLDLEASCVPRYRDRFTTHHEHVREIQRRHGYREFHDQPGHFRLARWLYTRAWLSAERPIVLFDLITARLAQRRILLPGVTTLTRLIAQTRERAAGRLWRGLAARPSLQQRTKLLALLQPAEGSRYSWLDRLRHSSTRVSVPGLVEAFTRLAHFRALDVGDMNLSDVPPGRLNVLARYAAAAKAQSIERMPEDRRIATLLAFAFVYESMAQDDAIDLLNQWITVHLARAESTGQQQRLRTLPELDAAALRLRQLGLIVLDPTYADERLRAAIFERLPRHQLEPDVTTVGTLSREEDTYYEHLVNNYSQVRRFLPQLLRTIVFEGNSVGQPVLDALNFLRSLEGATGSVSMDHAPRSVMTPAWRTLAEQSDGRVDRRVYTFCVLERLKDGLHRLDLFVSRSDRWGDPRAKLLQGAAWEMARSSVCRTLDRTFHAESEVAALAQQLDDAYRRTANDLTSNSAVTIEQVRGKDRLVLSPLDKLDEPASLTSLKEQVAGLLPRVDLPDALLEIQGLTGFADEFSHLSEANARVADLPLSICAVLIAEACNISLEPLVRPGVPALTYARLAWVQQNYIRAETLIRANARLVKTHASIPLTKAWGGGEVASADGLRFVVPVRTLHAGYNSKYFHVERGVTYYNFVSDQFSGFHSIVIPGTLQDSPYLLDGLLEQQTELQPTHLITDSAGYTDIVFGLFWLLGFQFSPRLADMGETRFWRIDRRAQYGRLNGIARQRVNTMRIVQHWDDLLRVAGSLKMGTVRASELIRVLQPGGKISSLGRAIGELGRIPKTLHLLNVISDPHYRRHTLTQLNRHEGRNRLARTVFHGQRGELRQRYREGQEDQLGALGLVVNALILWTTRYMDAALTHLRATGADVKLEDVARLSPLGNKHFNMLGRYHFDVPKSVLRGKLRPLRSPSVADQDGLVA